jgi:hypothetical protein
MFKTKLIDDYDNTGDNILWREFIDFIAIFDT